MNLEIAAALVAELDTDLKDLLPDTDADEFERDVGNLIAVQLMRNTACARYSLEFLENQKRNGA